MRKLTLSLFIGLVVTGFVMRYITCAKSNIEDSVVRLHVIANSDSEQDQQLKIKVRDAVVCYLRDKLSVAESAEETKIIIDAELKGIASVASDEIKTNGFDYGVSAQLGKFDFPTKRYGDTQLPAGEYNSLRVVIGNGEGQNWWCVLFPQLCFTGEGMPEESRQKLKNVLTEDEYSMITCSANGNIPVKIKFRLLELFGKK